MIIKENVSLKELHTFKVVANTTAYCEIKSIEEIQNSLDLIKKYEKRLILGEGSNLLFYNDYEGLIIKNNIIESPVLIDQGEFVSIEIYSGTKWDDFVSFTVENGFYGAENLAGIPGTVGAAPIQNIGAYGVEVKDIIDSVEGYLIKTSETKKYKNQECNFGYRTSYFKEVLKNDFFITKVIFKLNKTKKINLQYKSLAEIIKNIPIEKLNSKLISEKIREIRNSKLPDYKNLGNAGSFFKNPEIDYTHFEKIIKDYPTISYFKTDNSKVKISAGWLIEQCGFKGKRIGDVGCYSKQALVLINYGAATGEEIFEFAKKIMYEVKNKFDIELIPEVNIIK